MAAKNIFLIIALICTLLSGCINTGTENNSFHTGITGIIKTGVTEEEATIPVPPGGTTIEIARPDDPLNRLVLSIPAGSYSTSRDFRLNYAEIESHSFGEAFNPLTPLITIDNGGGYSEEIMTVKIPVVIPDGHFAMGFLYDAKTKQLEGLPTIAQDTGSITVATRHFSSIVISSISESLIKKDVDSGFRPGVDDWQFVNYGSYITPNGHCGGQSMTAMWYYCTQPDGPGKRLYNRYDNNGNQPATPKFQSDDSLGYRFASVVQNDIAWDSVSRTLTVIYAARSDELTWKMFAYSMQLTGEPQMTEIRDTKNDSGHAMVVYRIVNGAMYIADPNYPGDTNRQIEYASGKFKPYKSGANAGEIAKGNGETFDRITYVAKTALINWKKIAQRWQEFKNKTIGDDLYPTYDLYTIEEEGTGKIWDLQDGYTTSSNLLYITCASTQRGLTITAFLNEQILSRDAKGNYTLNPGNNRLGIMISGAVNGVDRFINFQYFNITCAGGLSIDPATLAGNTDQEYTFRAKVAGQISGARYDWYINNSLIEGKSTDKLSYTFKNKGEYTLSVKLIDSAGKELGTASSSISITDKSTNSGPNILAVLQNTKSFEAKFGGKLTFKNWSNKVSPPLESQDTHAYVVPIALPQITWSGTSFNGKVQDREDPLTPIDYEVSGTVSSDGRTLLTLNYSYDQYQYKYSDHYFIKLQIKNIPLVAGVDTVGGSLTGSTVRDHVVLLDWEELSYDKEGKVCASTVYLSTDWSATGTDAPFIKVDFGK